MTQQPEFSRPVPVDRIGPTGMDQRIEASAGECAALARRLGVPEVRAFAAAFHLAPQEGGRVAARGRLSGRLVRECVVTLDLFEVPVDEAFAIVFVPETLLDEAIDLEGDDEIPFAGGTIDLGEAAAEQLALTLDPYPRRPGAALPAAAREEPESPFAALARRGTLPGH